MFDFFKRKPAASKGGHYFFSLDIGTEFVKALLCESRGKTGAVLGVGRRRQNLGEMQSGVVTDIAGVIENCREAIYEAEKMAGVHAEQLISNIHEAILVRR